MWKTGTEHSCNIYNHYQSPSRWVPSSFRITSPLLFHRMASEIGWQSFLIGAVKVGTRPSKLRGIAMFHIINENTQDVIFESIRRSTATIEMKYGHKEFTGKDDAFYAISGSQLGPFPRIPQSGGDSWLSTLRPPSSRSERRSWYVILHCIANLAWLNRLRLSTISSKLFNYIL